MITSVQIFIKDDCPFCDKAKAFLTERGIRYVEREVTADNVEEFAQLTGAATVPQIVINGRLIGGWDRLSDLVEKGLFEALLNKESSK